MTEHTHTNKLRIEGMYIGKYYVSYLDTVDNIWGKSSIIVLCVWSGYLWNILSKLTFRHLPLGGEGKAKDYWKWALKVIWRV